MCGIWLGNLEGCSLTGMGGGVQGAGKRWQELSKCLPAP